MHAWPREGLARDAAGPILDLLFSPGDDGRVPTALVAGDRGTGRIARAAAGLLQAQGYTVGLSLKKGAYLHGVPLNISGDKLAEALQILQRDPFLECLVGAVSLNRSATHGLNFDACDVAAIVPGPHDEHSHAFAQGMDVLIKANRGRFVVSAGDTQARRVLAGVDPERVILVSNEDDDPDVQAQIAAGRCAVVTTWNGGGPHVTVLESGRTAASTPLPDGAQTKAKNITTELFVHAFMHALGLHNPKVVVNPPDTATLQETGCLVGGL
jgi:cyanophycin synthetase